MPGQTGAVPYQHSVFLVRITSCEGCGPQGTLDGPHLARPVRFSGMVQLIFAMEELMDQQGFPQREEEPLGVWPAAGTLPAPLGQGGAAAVTFEIKVLFRQNSSWQGELSRGGEDTKRRFRSVLELMHLIDGALLPEHGKGV